MAKKQNTILYSAVLRSVSSQLCVRDILLLA
jgi:hypothetical protein